MHIIQPPLFDFEVFISLPRNDRLVIVLEALDAEKLIAMLERKHSRGRKGHSVRGMWSALVAGVLNRCHSLADVIRLLKRDKDTRMICGFSKDKIPSEDALGRFLKKLVAHEQLLEDCFEDLVNRLRQLLPGFGEKLVADSTDIKACCNGHRAEPSDPYARWGRKGGSQEIKRNTAGGKKDKHEYWWFGYKLHLLVDAVYELPVSFFVTPANESDTRQLRVLLDRAKVDEKAARLEAVIADKGYDSKSNCSLIFESYGAAPIIPLIERKDVEQPDICNAKGTPTCGCGLEMVYWGRDGNYLKYRCPQAAGKALCKSRFRCSRSPYGPVLKLPIAGDVRRHPPVPRESKKWKRLYRMRSSVERVNSRLKGLLGLGQITVRGMSKVIVRSLLSLLAMLAVGVGMAESHRLRELRTLAA